MESQIEIQQGTIRYREEGTGEPIVLIHGLLANSLLWREIVPELAKDFRVIAPDLPLGSHVMPMKEGTDLSPPGLAAIIAAFLDALDLHDVTLVGNDTGGALCQLVAADHPERIGRLVLTPCDSHDNFLPPIFRGLQLAAHVPGAVWLIANTLRFEPLRRPGFAGGWLSKRTIEPDMAASFMGPVMSSRAVRREVGAILRGISTRYTEEAAERFGEFDRPVLIAWAPDDRYFPWRYAERLAREFPDARLERIEDSYTFVPVDQPGRTAQLIGQFARQPAQVAG